MEKVERVAKMNVSAISWSDTGYNSKYFSGIFKQMQYHHFLAADCCSGLQQLQSLYNSFLTLRLGLVPTGWLVIFSNANPYILQWRSISRIRLRTHTMCLVYFGSNISVAENSINLTLLQMQPPRGVLKKRCSKNI